MTGKTIIIDVSPNDSISDVKSIVQIKEGIPPDQQRLLLDDLSRLEDGRTLKDNNIKKGSSLRLFLGLSGMISSFTTTDADRSDPLTN
jgi:hypothetical protein